MSWERRSSSDTAGSDRSAWPGWTSGKRNGSPWGKEAGPLHRRPATGAAHAPSPGRGGMGHRDPVPALSSKKRPDSKPECPSKGRKIRGTRSRTRQSAGAVWRLTTGSCSIFLRHHDRDNRLAVVLRPAERLGGKRGRKKGAGVELTYLCQFDSRPVFDHNINTMRSRQAAQHPAHQPAHAGAPLKLGERSIAWRLRTSSRAARLLLPRW
jgi:hypothetical protein